MYTVACSFSHHLGRPSSSATRAASSITTPCGTNRASISRVTRIASYARAMAAPPTTKTSATTPRLLSRSPRAVKARSISARPRSTFSGPVTPPPSPGRTDRRHVSGTLRVPRQELRLLGPSSPTGTMAVAAPWPPPTLVGPGRVWPEDAQPARPEAHPSARPRSGVARRAPVTAERLVALSGTPP